MHILLLMTAFVANASPSDVASHFSIAPPPAAASCNDRFTRPDRLAVFEGLFPREGAAFRRNFKWRLIEHPGRRQLFGVPRRQQNDPPVFVVVPIDRGEHESILTVTIHPRNPNLDRRLAAEVTKLGKILSLVHRFPREEFGIAYPRGSLDIVLFEKPGVNNTATLGQVMEFASTMAALCPLPDVRPRLQLAGE